MSSEKQETSLEDAMRSAPTPASTTISHATITHSPHHASSTTESQDDEDESNTPTEPRLRANKQHESQPNTTAPGSDNWFSTQLPTGLVLEGEESIPSDLWLKIKSDSGPLPKTMPEPLPQPTPLQVALEPAPLPNPLHESSEPAPLQVVSEPLPETEAAASQPAATPDKPLENEAQPSTSPQPVPTPITPPPAQRYTPKLPRRLQRPYLLVAIILLVLVVLSGGTFTLTNLLNRDTTNTTDLSPSSSSLSAQQIDALRHLSTRMQYKQLASLYVARMSLDEEIGQLIMVEYADTYYSDDIKSMIKDLHAGGVIMYEFQMQSASQTKQDIDAMQQEAAIPLLISTDEEGGIVERLGNIYPPRPSALDIYNTGDPQVAADQGKLVAQDLLALGINTNLAPSVDVALVDGPGQTTRTFGYTADSVIKFAGPYIKAMQQQGVIATIKHFPGIGAATIDPHDGLPVITRTKEQLYQTELAPFKHFIQSKDKLENPGIVMPTDILMTAIDSVYPAELSRTFMTDILRKEFGYDGVALTDALYMKGVTINGSPITMPQASVMALQAGNDMLLGPTGYTQTLDIINAIKAALQNGTLSKARLDEAATRIIALKMQSHLMPATPPHP